MTKPTMYANFKTYIWSHYRVLIYLSAFLIGMSLVIRGTEILIFFGVLSFLFYISILANISKTRIVTDFFSHGFIICLFANAFILQVASQNWLVQLPKWYTLMIQVISLLIVASVCGSLSILFGLILYKIKNTMLRLASVLLLWPLLEISRSYFYAIISYGPGGIVAPNFNWGSLAIPASGTPLVFASRNVGFFGLTFVVVLISLGIYSLIIRKSTPGIMILALSTLIIFSGWQRSSHAHSRPMKIAVVHLQEQDVMDYWRNWDSIPDNLQLIVLPEYSGVLENPELKTLAKKLTDNGVGVTSRMIGKSPNAYNQLVYFDNKGNIINTQNKSFLIPSGEFMPYAVIAMSKMFGQQSLINSFEKSQRLQRSEAPERVFSHGSYKFGALVCSGVLSPYEYGSLANNGADVLTNSASLSFIQPGSVYHLSGENLARFQAVYNDRYFVQSSRSGESYIITPQGKFLQTTSENKTKIITATIFVR